MLKGVTRDQVDKLATSKLLASHGATIQELNAVRKHLSSLKGGKLAQLAQPADVLGLILSDVIGDPLDVIASGPIVPDPTTFGDAVDICRRRGIIEQLPVLPPLPPPPQ
mmetsp:Transcript_11765/g.25128  ORF Transcript_11765/g.25128 Transcript_11765/m.25128 type:complete len:109 (+) Transcript_11765:446-772(+)